MTFPQRARLVVKRQWQKLDAIDNVGSIIEHLGECVCLYVRLCVCVCVRACVIDAVEFRDGLSPTYCHTLHYNAIQ